MSAHRLAVSQWLIRLLDVTIEVYTSLDFEAPPLKTLLLLQAHFLQLPPYLAADQVLVLGKVLNPLSASVDVMSPSTWLSALGAMDISQIGAQAICMWERDSPLLTLRLR